MPIYSQFELQKAVYATLSGDATLAGLVSGVYDRVPEDAVFPFAALGEMEGRQWANAATGGVEYHFNVHVLSREGGRKQAATILTRIHTLLHHVAPALENGHSVMLMRYESSLVDQEEDGLTYHGVMRFRALVQ